MNKFVGICLGVALLLLGGSVYLSHEAQEQAAAVTVQFHKSSLNAAVQADRNAAEGRAIIATVERQLHEIIVHGNADIGLSSAVHTILCDSLIFDEQSAEKKDRALAKAMVRQSCVGVTFPK
jgi:hypothetical protein